MQEEKNIKVIETPSSAFLDLSEEIRKDIEKFAEDWKRKSAGTGERNVITSAVRKKYKDNSRAYEYFSCLKQTTKDNSGNIQKRNLKNEEAIEREKFSVVMRKFLKKYLNNNLKIDHNSKIFLLDQNYNLPPFFWTRMYREILPIIIKQDSKNKEITIRAWQLAIGIMKKHETELGDRLQKTDFNDLDHVCNSIIQFFKKYMLTTYQELMKKARQQVMNKKIAEKKIQEQNIDNKTSEIKKRGGGAKEVQKIGFDTTGLL